MESSLRTTLEAELEQSLTFPYSNIARVYRLGEPKGPKAAKLPKSFGGDCLEQVARLRARLRRKGIHTKTILNPEAMHFALIGETGGDFFYLDPALRALQPVVFTDGVEENTVQAYPCVNDQWSRLIAQKNSGQLTAKWAIPNGDNIREMVTHTFALAEPDATPKENLDNQRAFFSAQKNLHWQIPDPKTGELLTVRMMKAQEALGISVIGIHGYKMEKAPEFAPLLERVIASTKTTEQEIREFITETRRRWLGFSSQL